MDLKLGDTQLLIQASLKAGLLRNQCAYLLATSYHETAHTMKPIKEMGSQSYLTSRRYYPYIGRGYAQVTWDYNYKKASTYCGVDFIAHPELLLDPQYAVPIIVIFMKNGWFTGKKLSDYIDLQHSDFVNARRIINGTDQATLIAGYAKTYDALLTSAGYGVPETPVAPVGGSQSPVTNTSVLQPPVATQTVVVTPAAPVPVSVPTPTTPAPKMGIMDILVLLFTAIFKGGIK